MTATQRTLPSGDIFKLSCFFGTGTASTGTVVLTPGSATLTGIMWAFVQIPGADTTTPYILAHRIESTSTSATQSTSLTLPNTPAAGNAVLAAIGHNAAEDISAGSNFTKGTNQANMGSPSGGLNYEYKTTSLDTVVDATWATSSGYVAAGIEIAAAGGVGGPGATDFMGDIPI
jgi:hypothetical protein